MLLRKETSLIVVIFIINLFAKADKGNKTSLNYAKLTSGPHDETPGNARALTAGGNLTQNGYCDVVLLSYEGAGLGWNYKNEFYVFAETTKADELWIKNLYPKGNVTFYRGIDFGADDQ